MQPEVLLISQSTRKKWIMVLAAFGVLLLCALLLWLTNPFSRQGPVQPRRVVKFVAASALSAVAVVCYLVVLFSASKKRFLRIGPQGIELLSRDDFVVGSLPFSNIERMEKVDVKSVPFICIWLGDEHRPDTFWPGGWVARRLNRIQPGCDVGLGPEWSVSLDELYGHVMKAYQDTAGGRP